MKIKTTLVVIALIVAPDLALAMGGCSKGEDKTSASTCAVGMIWDAATETCVTPTNS